MGRLWIGLIVGLLFAACRRDGGGLTTRTSDPPTAAGVASSVGVRVGDAAGSAALHVLFVGNSYTYVNDLPGRVRALSVSAGGGDIEVDSVVQGGARLVDHVRRSGALDRIHRGGWTHVVLQGQSEEPLRDPSTFEAAALTLAREAKAAGARVVFYETWARRAGDAVYQERWSGGSPAAMQAGLRAEYQKVAARGGGVVAPAGDAWEKALAQRPSLTLFQSDGSHPAVPGTYLVGCVFFDLLTGRSPVGIGSPPPPVSVEDATFLQAIAVSVRP